MKDFIESTKNFIGLPLDEEFLTSAENKKNSQLVIDDWMLGPDDPSNEPSANKPYWQKLAKVMKTDEKEARRQRCANCCHFDNHPVMQARMDRIAWNPSDNNAGYRGFCHRFEFISHDMRSCQGWKG